MTRRWLDDDERLGFDLEFHLFGYSLPDNGHSFIAVDIRRQSVVGNFLSRSRGTQTDDTKAY